MVLIRMLVELTFRNMLLNTVLLLTLTATELCKIEKVKRMILGI